MKLVGRCPPTNVADRGIRRERSSFDGVARLSGLSARALPADKFKESSVASIPPPPVPLRMGNPARRLRNGESRPREFPPAGAAAFCFRDFAFQPVALLHAEAMTIDSRTWQGGQSGSWALVRVARACGRPSEPEPWLRL